MFVFIHRSKAVALSRDAGDEELHGRYRRRTVEMTGQTGTSRSQEIPNPEMVAHDGLELNSGELERRVTLIADAAERQCSGVTRDPWDP